MTTFSSSLWHLSASEENLRRQTTPSAERTNWEGYIIPKSPSYIAAIKATEGKMDALTRSSDEVPLMISGSEDVGGFVAEGKHIDFVLVYTESSDDGMKKKDKENAQKRDEFERNLGPDGYGLLLQRVQSVGNEGEIKTFVLVHAPWDVLSKQAEEMMIRCPVREADKTPGSWYSSDYLGFAKKAVSIFQVTERMDSLHRKKITAFFNRDKVDLFLEKDRDSFFSEPDRIRMVNRILASTSFSPAKAEDFGIHRLLYESVYDDAYPLHDGPAVAERSDEYPDGNLRAQLHSEWASFSQWHKAQPLNAIKHYLGVRVAFYFAWLGTYNFMLTFAAFVGFWCLVGGLVTMENFIPVKEICDERNSKSFYMCPLCDKTCSFWTLTVSCSYSKITHLFDHEGTVFFAVFMSFWATIFLEIWKRSQIRLAYEWDMMSYEDEFQPPRPEFVAKAKRSRVNPVTGKTEPYVPIFTRVARYTCTAVTLAFMILLVIGAVVGVVIYRAAMVAALSSHPDERVQQRARVVTSITASVINLVVITVLGNLYEWLAKRLTDWENPRTMTDYQDLMTVKLFSFQSVNYYSSLFYIAFFKGAGVVGHPGNFTRVSGSRLEGCDPSGCLMDLCIQLAVIMGGKQLILSIQKFAVPALTRWRAQRSATERQASSPWERDLLLNEEPEMRMFHEYHDMVIQFGLVTLFVAAFPLAPLLALINNVVELRIDAINFVVNFRRPVPQRARGIGAWFEILQAVSRVAVLVNSFIIAFTSEFIPRLVYQYWYSPDGSLNGYVDNSLSFFNVSDFRESSYPKYPLKNLPYNQSFCRYKEYFEPVKPYRHSRQYYVVLAARLTFVIAFQYFVFAVVNLLDWLIPDVPRSLDVQIKRENYIARECMTRNEAGSDSPSRPLGSADTLYMSVDTIADSRD